VSQSPPGRVARSLLGGARVLATGVAEVVERLRLDLADALRGNAETPAGAGGALSAVEAAANGIA